MSWKEDKKKKRKLYFLAGQNVSVELVQSAENQSALISWMSLEPCCPWALKSSGILQLCGIGGMFPKREMGGCQKLWGVLNPAAVRVFLKREMGGHTNLCSAPKGVLQNLLHSLNLRSKFWLFKEKMFIHFKVKGETGGDTSSFPVLF